MAVKRFFRFAGAAAAAGILILLFPQRVHAYLDPGTGSLVLQALVAGIFAASLAVKVYWKKIKSAVAGLFLRDRDPKKLND